MTERLTLSFGKSHQTKCEVIAHCSFDLHFSHVSDIKYLSIYVLWIYFLYIFLRDMSIHSLVQFLIDLFFFFFATEL